MLKNTLKVENQVEAVEAAGDCLVERRERLGQLIGRLLARIWLRRLQDTETELTSGSDSLLDDQTRAR